MFTNVSFKAKSNLQSKCCMKTALLHFQTELYGWQLMDSMLSLHMPHQLHVPHMLPSHSRVWYLTSTHQTIHVFFNCMPFAHLSCLSPTFRAAPMLQRIDEHVGAFGFPLSQPPELRQAARHKSAPAAQRMQEGPGQRNIWYAHMLLHSVWPPHGRSDANLCELEGTVTKLADWSELHVLHCVAHLA
jgi:hypothetical protein